MLAHTIFLYSFDQPFLDPKEVTERVIEVVKNFEKVNGSKVTGTARFKEDLDLDSKILHTFLL